MRPCVRRVLGITLAYCSQFVIFFFFFWFRSFFFALGSDTAVERYIFLAHISSFSYGCSTTLTRARLSLCISCVLYFYIPDSYGVRLNESYAIILNSCVVRPSTCCANSIRFSHFEILENVKQFL